MAISDPAIRDATKADANALAELINIAGEGMPVYLWRRMAEPGEDVWAVGRRRAMREEGGFSYRNALCILHDGEVAATLMGYRLPDEPEPLDEQNTPPMFIPLLQLENLAPGSWYVNVLAAYPDCRGQGFGTALLRHAERLAAKEGSAGLSIIVADNNQGARRLYERFGFTEQARRQMVKEGWRHDGDEWVLLTRPLTMNG